MISLLYFLNEDTIKHTVLASEKARSECCRNKILHRQKPEENGMNNDKLLTQNSGIYGNVMQMGKRSGNAR